MKIHSLPQAAEALGVNYVALWRWAKAGRVPTVEVGRNRLGITDDDLRTLRAVLEVEGREGVLDGLLSAA
jgi:predicted site-specific integrase-resolvase